jgi:hypothetical protein
MVNSVPKTIDRRPRAGVQSRRSGAQVGRGKWVRFPRSQVHDKDEPLTLWQGRGTGAGGEGVRTLIEFERAEPGREALQRLVAEGAPGCFLSPLRPLAGCLRARHPALSAVWVEVPIALQGCVRGALMRPFQRPPLPCRYCQAESIVIAV